MKTTIQRCCGNCKWWANPVPITTFTTSNGILSIGDCALPRPISMRGLFIRNKPTASDTTDCPAHHRKKVAASHQAQVGEST